MRMFCLQGAVSTILGGIRSRPRAATMVSMISAAPARWSSPRDSAMRDRRWPGRALSLCAAAMARNPGSVPVMWVNSGAGAPVS